MAAYWPRFAERKGVIRIAGPHVATPPIDTNYPRLLFLRHRFPVWAVVQSVAHTNQIKQRASKRFESVDRGKRGISLPLIAEHGERRARNSPAPDKPASRISIGYRAFLIRGIGDIPDTGVARRKLVNRGRNATFGAYREYRLVGVSCTWRRGSGRRELKLLGDRGSTSRLRARNRLSRS